jgi:Zn-finger nucleic acid-binding protein
MKCPKCTADMTQLEYQGVTVNKCSGCEGLWFNNLEHEVLKTVAGSESIDTGDPSDGAQFDKIEDYVCPNCSGGMDKLVDKDQPHIWYEVCHSCYGVFFDAGEFRDYKKSTFFDLIGSYLTSERN